MITFFPLEHTDHSNSPLNFLSENQQLSTESQLFVSGIKEASASNSKNADVLTKNIGDKKHFKAKDKGGGAKNKNLPELSFRRVTTKTWAYTSVFGFFRICFSPKIKLYPGRIPF